MVITQRFTQWLVKVASVWWILENLRCKENDRKLKIEAIGEYLMGRLIIGVVNYALKVFIRSQNDDGCNDCGRYA